MKTIKQLLITIAVLLCSTTTYAYDFEVDGIYYNIISTTDFTAEVTSGDTGYSGSVTIPSTVSYSGIVYNVISIGKNAFYYDSNLTSITIPEGVISIGECAFYYCKSLTSIIIPESVTSIDLGAFYNCSSLAYIDIPKSVTSISEYAYTLCSSLTSITIPEGVTSIGECAFGGCESAISITIPESVTSIGRSAFYLCSSLTSIEIPNSVTSIGDKAFYLCSSLTSIEIPNSVTFIGEEAFYGCSSLTSIEIPNSVTSIGDKAFYLCSSLTSIEIPNSVTFIGEEAFYGCSSLRVIKCHAENVPETENSAFNNCPSDMIILVPSSSLSEYKSKSPWNEYKLFVISEGSIIDYDGYSLIYTITDLENAECKVACAINPTAPTTLTIPSNVMINETSFTVTSIPDSAFLECNKFIGDLVIPNTVKSVGIRAFRDCTGFTGSLTLSENLETIGDLAFAGGGDIEVNYTGDLIIPNTVTSIGSAAFQNCPSLTSVTFGENSQLTYIGQSAFRNCSKLTGDLTIPNSVTYIGRSAFGECVGFDGILTLPENLDTIHDYTFGSYDSTMALTGNVVIPETVKYIGDAAFQKCSSLENVTFGENSKLTYIGQWAFLNCSSLTGDLTIPNSVTSIGDYAFYNCTSLKDIRIEDGDTSLELGEYLFSHCPLEFVYLGRNLSYESSFYVDAPFNNINTLYSVVTGPKVTHIRDYAFEGCYNIRSLTINSGVVSIGSSAFSTPDKVIWLTNTPPKGYYYTEGRINYVANEQYTSLDNVHVYPYLSSMFETDGVKYVPVSPSERTCHAIDCAYDSTATTINVGETVLFQGVKMNVTEVMPLTFYENSHIKEVSVSHSGNIGNQAFYNCDSLETALISNHGDLGNQAFYHCSSLNNVTLGNNVSSLGNGAFYRCVGLQEIVIPDSVNSIGDSCFSACSALANVDLGQGVNVINKYAFQDCSSLSQISIPKSAKEIGDNVFEGCTILSDIIIEDRNEILSLGSNGSSALFADCPLDSLYIGGKITYETSSYYGYSPFYRNTSLRTVVITNKEDQIHDNEFYGCTNLKNVVIGHGVESIGDYAFSGCSSLDGFSFGSNLKTIGTEAFSDCTNITSITSHAEVPPTCGEQALDDINKWTCVLKVPQNYASAYQAAEQWKEFFYIEDVVEIELFTITYIVDGEVYATGKYAVGDEIIPEEEPIKEGYTFSGWSEIPETMPAEDVTVTGSFSINSYDLVYMVDSEEYKRVTLEFGSEIVPEKEPEKEGYTFSGWSEIPETMPAEDVTVTGSFSINSYDLVYMIDGEEYKRVTLEFGSEIVPEEEPEKEGYTFSGWSEIPETMPAHDVEVTGSFILTNVSEITAKVSLQINGNNISLSNANNSTIAIYSINGVLVKKIDKYAGEEIALEKGVYIVSVGDKAMKIIL